MQGDYLFRTFIGGQFQNGMWGLLRVGEAGKDVVTVMKYCGQPAFTIEGVNTRNPANGHMAATVTIMGAGLPATARPVDSITGKWSFTSNTITTLPTITVTSAQGGTTSATQMCPIQTPPAQRPAAPATNQDVNRFRQLAPTIRSQQR